TPASRDDLAREVVSDLERERGDRRAGVDRASGREQAAVRHDEVRYGVAAAATVRHRSRRVISHPCGAEQVPTRQRCEWHARDAVRPGLPEHLLTAVETDV